MELRVLSVRDRERITELFRDVFTHEPWNDDWSDQQQLNAYIGDLTGQSYSLTLGYFEEDRLAGVSMGHVKHWYAGTEYILEEFFVDRQLQGRGIGSRFMTAIESYLAQNGIFRMFLQTEKDVPAYGFYRHRGFRELSGHVSFAKTFGGMEGDS